MAESKSFNNYCTCGGYAHSVNGRNPRRPHMDWCPQKDEYNKWYDENHPNPKIKRGESQ